MQRCRRCAFEPEDDESRLRSAYLSILRLQDEDAADDEVRQRLGAELDTTGAAIRAGTPPTFDAAEMGRLRKTAEAIDSLPASAPWMYLLRLFLPAILLIAALFAIGKFFRVLKHGW